MKKKVLTSLAVGVFGVGLMAGNAMAYPLDPGTEDSLQEVLNNITTGGTSSIDVTTDYVAPEIDDYWQIGGTGTSAATLVIEIAGNANFNSFGVYDYTNSSTKVELFAGTNSPGVFPGFMTSLSFLTDGSVILNSTNDTGIDFSGNRFGFYLNNGTNIFYSDTLLNTADSFDHMFAYEGVGDYVTLPGTTTGPWGSNEYILAWEDVLGGGDQDYNDFVVMVESVNPVPEPASMLLFGAGLAGLAGIVTRRKQN